jgi:hypothetical protein
MIVRNRNEIRGTGTSFHTRTRGEESMDVGWLLGKVVLAGE